MGDAFAIAIIIGLFAWIMSMIGGGTSGSSSASSPTAPPTPPATRGRSYTPPGREVWRKVDDLFNTRGDDEPDSPLG